MVLVRLRTRYWLALWLFAAAVWAQTPAPTATYPQTAAELYTRLGSVPLDEQRVFHIRGATIDRASLHIDLEDGTLAFTEDICGRITGAYFEGEGEVLLRPPDRVERGSMALFTGMAILEEQFTSGYLRFNDDTASELRPYLSAAEEQLDFVKQANPAIQPLATLDTLRLLLDFSHFLPASSGTEIPHPDFPRLLHAHLLGRKLGAFEVYWDAAIPEPLWAGQVRRNGEIPFFDIWTSFAPANLRRDSPAPIANDVSVSAFRIRSTVQPPLRLQASADLDVGIRNGGERTLMFELSRYLKVDHVEDNGHPVDFIQNQAIEGSQLQRRGNDLVALVFPAPLTKGQQLKLHFEYAGDVLSEAGSGLLYVGERGTWYPNFGLSPARFDLEFHYPAAWTLVATGKQVAADSSNAMPSEGERVSRWISDRPIPVAGFNLGRYIGAEAKSGSVVVEAYGTKGVERSFPRAPMEVLVPPKVRPTVEGPGSISTGPIIVTSPAPPSPARNAQAVADQAAKAVGTFSEWFGPYPFTSLSFTQMPGDLSQGWPGLVFLSTYAFLSPQEQMDLKLDPVTRALDSQVLVHETAHQWWGDLVLWKSYRDQWLMEGLANYSSLLLLEQKNPALFRQVLEKYRADLLSKNDHDEWLRDAGPVTLGQRLISSHFPNAYEAITYERGTWLFHMLRTMLRDCEGTSRRNRGAIADEPFFRTLRKIRERSAGKSLTTQEFFKVFEEELPRPLWYEKRHSLDWFIDGWINGTAIPTLETRDVRITAKEQSAIASGVIVQKEAPDDLVTAVPVYAQTVSKSLVYIGEVLADGAETTFRFTAPKDARKPVLDPHRTILTALK